MKKAISITTLLVSIGVSLLSSTANASSKFHYPFLDLIFAENITLTKSSIDLELNPPPINDLCEDAIDLGILECGFFEQFFEDPTATADPEATGNCINPITEPGVWYTFQTPPMIPYTTLLFNGSWTQVEIFKTSSDCSALEYVDCYFGIDVFVPESDTKYYFLVVGGIAFSTPLYIPLDCDETDFFFDLDLFNPWINHVTTDCASSSDVIQCGSDHVVWGQYTTGCYETDLFIEVFDYTGQYYTHASQVSVTAVYDDCSSIASDLDPNGTGYICNGLDGDVLSLENIPPFTTIYIALGSDNGQHGHFDLSITETSTGVPLQNEECNVPFELFNGFNADLTNLCAGFSSGVNDQPMVNCPGQYEATVWYEFDPGNEPQDISIEFDPLSITNPAIAAYEVCGQVTIGSNCNGQTLELYCIDFPIHIQVGSSDENAGEFGLNITTTPSGSPAEANISGTNICSDESADILVDIPSGNLVDIEITIDPSSSPFVEGMTEHNFFSVSSGLIEDILINSSSTIQQVTYIVSINSLNSSCETDPIEYTISVYPQFSIDPFMVEACESNNLELTIDDIIQGGTPPYSSIQWLWNGNDLIGTGNALNYIPTEDGFVTVEVIDAVGCTASGTVDITLNSATQPSFDFSLYYCKSTTNVITFPNESIENISGTWNPDIIDVFSTPAGIYEVFFTPDETSCALPISLIIEIDDGYMPQFDLPELLCAEEDLFIFPTFDNNSISGFWQFPSMDLSAISGVVSNTFTPNSIDCSVPYIYTFEVADQLQLSFDIPDTLCSADPPLTLPSSSIEGFNGSWDIPSIDPSSIAQDSIIIAFTPLDGQSPCIGENNVTIHIAQPTNTQFSLPASLCSFEDTLFLPALDNQGVAGSWSSDFLVPDPNSQSLNATFIPDNSCFLPFDYSVTLIQPISPLFDIDSSFCQSDQPFSLPDISNNNIQGNWSIPAFDPDSLAGQSITSTFFAPNADTCVLPLQLTFFVDSITPPSFNIPDTICFLDNNLPLPLFSSNGIDGSWSPDTILVANNPGTIIQATFTPSDQFCSSPTTFDFVISEPFDILVNATDPSGCTVADGSIQIIGDPNLEFSIDNGNSWQASNSFDNLAAGAYTIDIRDASTPLCIQSISADISTDDAPILNNLDVQDISDCSIDNGTISIDAIGDNLEYSIDNGASWQASNVFSNLPSGQYTINIRELLSDCIISASANINDINPTQIVDILASDVSDCDANDGSIVIQANGDNLIYSIDNGISWSNQNVFDNLQQGEYSIIIQSDSATNCDAMASVAISGPPIPQFEDIIISNPTSCLPDSGTIAVSASGSDIEFSFDGGASWQDDSSLDNLSEGEYLILIRNSDFPNCFSQQIVDLDVISSNLDTSAASISPPSDCDLFDASITIDPFTNNLEFSIDNGASWQTNFNFPDLSSGTYQIISRVIGLPDCNVIQSIDIPEVECNCLDLIVQASITPLPCDASPNGAIELLSIQGMEDENNLSIQWNNGSTGPTLNSVDSGFYSFSIFYDEVCTFSDTLFVPIADPISFDVQTSDLDCPYSNNGSITIDNVTGGSNQYSFAINDLEFQQSNSFTNLGPGLYEVAVIDEQGCLQSQFVEVYQPDSLSIDLNDINNIQQGDFITLDPQIDPASIDSFAWSALNYSNSDQLIIEVQPQVSTSYSLEVFLDGCVYSKTITVAVVQIDNPIFFANIFSPNQDNVNDVFFIQGNPNANVSIHQFSIFDRWGNRVFSIENPHINEPNDGWDGSFNGDFLNDGVFVYSIKYSLNNKEFADFGSVTLVR